MWGPNIFWRPGCRCSTNLTIILTPIEKLIIKRIYQNFCYAIFDKRSLRMDRKFMLKVPYLVVVVNVTKSPLIWSGVLRVVNSISTCEDLPQRSRLCVDQTIGKHACIHLRIAFWSLFDLFVWGWCLVIFNFSVLKLDIQNQHCRHTCQPCKHYAPYHLSYSPQANVLIS